MELVGTCGFFFCQGALNIQDSQSLLLTAFIHFTNFFLTSFGDYYIFSAMENCTQFTCPIYLRKGFNALYN